MDDYCHVSWGPEGLKMSDAEKSAYVDELKKQVAKELENTVQIPVSQLIDIADALRNLNNLGKLSVNKWMSISKEEADLRHKIREFAEFPMMFAEQWLPNEIQKDRRKKRLLKK